MMYKDELKQLQELGCTNFEVIPIVSNYAFKFKLNDATIILNHNLNLYGDSVDYWEIYELGNTTYFDTFAAAINYIKENK